MKTIAVINETHAPLTLRETSHTESHSEVDKKVVPVAGTLGFLLCCVEEAGSLRLLGNEALEEAADLRPTAKYDQWS